ncbi:MAG: hypothetical protein F4Y86_12015 [Gammaproteobacteria bacterium]|nr:hypothetical protein [Gammaproteobacteria bacterium]
MPITVIGGKQGGWPRRVDHFHERVLARVDGAVRRPGYSVLGGLQLGACPRAATTPSRVAVAWL